MTQEITNYAISKERCTEMIHGVCRQCGGELKPMETVDNSNNPTFWAGCEKCDIFCWGTNPVHYEIARQLVDERNYIAYSHLEMPSEKSTDGYREYYRLSQISGAVYKVDEIMWVYEKVNRELNAQASVATESDSNNSSDQQKSNSYQTPTS